MDFELNFPEVLVEAIVMQAVKDYKEAVRNMTYISDRPKYPAAHWQEQKQDAIDFLNSEWFGVICALDPQAILWKLEKYERDFNKRVKH